MRIEKFTKDYTCNTKLYRIGTYELEGLGGGNAAEISAAIARFLAGAPSNN